MDGRILLFATLCLLALGTAQAQAPIEHVDALPAYNADAQQNSISGISSGGYMAQQFHTAYADALIGVGVLAGGPYYCAENNITLVLGRCMFPTEDNPPDAARLAWLTQDFAERGYIADPAAMADDQVWLFASPEDATVYKLVMDKLVEYYGHFVPGEQIEYVTHIPAAHSMPTKDWGYPCDHVGSGTNPDDHFINDCDYDAAGEALAHIYRRMKHRVDEPQGRFIRFPQDEFIEAPRSHGMDDYGYAYVPQQCDAGARCRVHVVFHGCRQYHERIGEIFFRNAGYNQWADRNRLILIYPQVYPTSSQSNANGCWDWWGYDDAHYMWRDGRQMRAIKAMIDRVTGAQTQTPAPESPSGLSAEVELDASVTLTWEEPADPQVEGYMVYRAEAEGGPYLAATSNAVVEPRLTLTDLEPGNHHFVLVAVGQEAIESVPTPPLTVTVPGL